MEYAVAGLAIAAYQASGRPGPLEVYSSSQLVVYQMRGVWPVRKGAYVPVREAVCKLVARCAFEIRWVWVPLSKNLWASELARLALSEVGAVPFIAGGKTV